MRRNQYRCRVKANFDDWAIATLKPETYAALPAHHGWLILALQAFDNRNKLTEAAAVEPEPEGRNGHRMAA